MKVYRVENNKGVGPIYGIKNIKKVYFDYSTDEKYVQYLKDIGEYNYSDLFDEYNEEESYLSRSVIKKHKMPHEFKQYFKNIFDSANKNKKYCFSWKTYKHCIDFVKKGNKRNWILHKEGFFIVEYETNDYIIFPDGQIAFNKKKAKITNKYKNCFC